MMATPKSEVYQRLCSISNGLELERLAGEFGEVTEPQVSTQPASYLKRREDDLERYKRANVDILSLV